MTAVFEFVNGSKISRRVNVKGIDELSDYVRRAVRWTEETGAQAFVYAYPGFRRRSVEKMLLDIADRV